jgi:hypothetical protein
LIKTRPPRWFVEGQAGFASSSEHPWEYYKKASEMNRLVVPNTIKDLEPSTIAKLLQNPLNDGILDYHIGFQAIEVLAAISGPHSTMEVFVEMANGKSFNQAFETIYKISWANAITPISEVISSQLKNNADYTTAQFSKSKQEIGIFKWPERKYFEEALFN